MFDDLNLIDDFKNTKKLINSSAPLSFDVSKRFYDKGVEITEIYGSTETGGIASRIAPKNIEWNLFSYIKVSGKESVIENIDNKKLTELIIESEAISEVYDKMFGYNTGDVVEFYDNGKFALAGRNTRFVKISGKRVDLKYVENKFKEYVFEETGRSISDDLLYAGEKNEKIYIFYEFDFLKSVNDIKNDLKKHLPGYAIPRRYFSQKIPRNEMGKINKLKIEEIVKNI